MRQLRCATNPILISMKTNRWIAFDDGYKFQLLNVAEDTPNSWPTMTEAVDWYVRSLELYMIQHTQKIKNLEAQRARALAWKQ